MQPSKRLLGIAVCIQLSLPAQTFDLTIDNIMRGPGLVGYEPRDVRWSGDNRKIYFSWKQVADPVLNDFDTYVVDRDGSNLTKLSKEEGRLAPPSGGEYSADRTKVVSIVDGDLYVHDLTLGQGRRLTRTEDVESSARFLRDGRRVSFVRGGNLFTVSLDTGVLSQITDVRPPGSTLPPARRQTTDNQEFLKKEERELLDTVRQRAVKREQDEERRKPHILATRQSTGAMQLTPDEKYVTVNITEGGERARNTIVPAYVTESAYAETVSSRTNVGDAPGRNLLAFVSVETGELKWIEPEGQLHRTTTVRESVDDPKTAQPRQVDSNIVLSQPVWSGDGRKAVVSGRSHDRKDRWIFALDVETAKLRVLVAMHDDAWVNGPDSNALGWMKNNEDVFFLWERDGYSHLYLASFSGGEPRQLTSGKFEVLSARLSEDKESFYLETNEVHPGERHLHRMKIDGGGRVRITAASGLHETAVSRDARYVADVFSFTNRPPELYVQENRSGASSRKLTSSPAPDFWNYPWSDAPIVQVPARDGVRIPGRLLKPANPRGGPAVIFVHGAGYLQNVHRGWSNYYREYMFHHFLRERGYTVLDIDYRGSAGYGRDWRTAVYRHMGGQDLDDHIDAARWLVSAHGVDSKRIGIYGGSYGGFITLMAMFTQPGVFAAGAALRPVTDWAHYNQGYTSSILNLPQSDSEAYRRSSPIYFASGLKGALLICHGMVDVNVHFQDSVRLVQKLIELRKENWELAVYPVEDHAFVQPSSWADEYKRVFKLFEDNLKPR